MDHVRLFRTVITLSLLSFFSTPSALIAYDFKEKIPIRVQLNIDWSHKGRRTHSKGHFTINVRGKAELVKEKKNYLKYMPSKMQAMCHYKHEETMMDPKNKCFGKVINKIEGSGSVSFLKDSTGISGGQFTMSVHLGQLGKIAASRYTGQMDQESFYEECKNCRDDNYEWMMVIPFNATFQQLCDHPYLKEGMAHASLIVFKELTSEGMHGSYKWNTDGEGNHMGRVHIMDFHGIRKFGPSEGEGANYRLSWMFGEVKPVVQIWCGRDNITDQNSKDVLVGQKIKLEAVVKPQGVTLDNGRWVIQDNKNIISGWEASKDSGTLIPFKDKDKKEIEFCWTKGSFTGTAMAVKYSGKADGKKVEAKTTINVFQPSIKTFKVKPSKTISVDHVMKPPDCELFLGKRPADENPGIEITSEIKMPVLPADKGVERPHLLQYVQRIKEEVLYPYRGDFFRRANDEWRCDERYPYGGKKLRAPYRLKMDDTPGSIIGKSTRELYHHDQFDTCLMFIPSASPDDSECCWVPLKTVEWSWASAIKLNVDWKPELPCNTNTYKILYKVRPKPKILSSSPYPTWTSNIKPNPRDKMGEEEWKGFLDAMKERLGK